MSSNPLVKRTKQRLRRLLRRYGIEVMRVPPTDRRTEGASFDASLAIPPEIEKRLSSEHPRLRELRASYSQSDLPMAIQTMWGSDYLDKELDLRYFRGDNVYVWQFRNVGNTAHNKYYLFLRDLASRDTQSLLTRLDEDGMFGCWTFDYPGWPLVSRDLLDSINELYFLDKHLNFLSAEGMVVLDIGAGYGRLAHRSLAAAPNLAKYFCVDAVPESTFLCEFYLDYRQCDDRAEVVPLHEVDSRLQNERIDLAVNIHSFSEMSQASIEGWISRIADKKVTWLLIVPNDADKLMSMQADGERISFEPILERYGYSLIVKEPIYPDPTMQAFMGVSDHFFLFKLDGTTQ